jgi:hypothetical protein
METKPSPLDTHYGTTVPYITDLARALDAVKPIEEPKAKSDCAVKNHFAYFD